jgi:hypothetical protein
MARVSGDENFTPDEGECFTVAELVSTLTMALEEGYIDGTSLVRTTNSMKSAMDFSTTGSTVTAVHIERKRS